MFNEESSPDEEKLTTETAQTANECKTEESLEEEQNRLRMMQEQLKLVKRGKTSLEQVEESGLVKDSQKVEALTITSKTSSLSSLESGKWKPTAPIKPQFARVADQIRSRVQKDRQLEGKQIMARLPSPSKDFFSNQKNKSPSLCNVSQGSSVPNRNLLTQGQKSADVREAVKNVLAEFVR